MAKAEFRDYVSPEGLTLTDSVVKINRCAAVVKGGRRFSFSALVAVGDQAGDLVPTLGMARRQDQHRPLATTRFGVGIENHCFLPRHGRPGDENVPVGRHGQQIGVELRFGGRLGRLEF